MRRSEAMQDCRHDGTFPRQTAPLSPYIIFTAVSFTEWRFFYARLPPSGSPLTLHAGCRPKPSRIRVELDEAPCIGFFGHYDNGQMAEVSWAFIREMPSEKPGK